MFYNTLKVAGAICAMQFPASVCAQPAQEPAVKAWIVTLLEAKMHPQRSLRMHPLTYADVWSALPMTREHREKNTLRLFDETSGAASYVVFDRSTPSLDIDRVESRPDGSEELNTISFRLIRERVGSDLGAEELVRQYNPTQAIGASNCVPEASNIARSLDTAALGWRCTNLGNELQVDIFRSCASRAAQQKCLVVQISATWPMRNR